MLSLFLRKYADHLVGLVIILTNASLVHAINITVQYDDTQPNALKPAFDPNGTQLLAIANYAASFYENAFEDNNHSITLTFWYTDLTNLLGDHDNISEDGNNRESVGNIKIDALDGMGAARNYFFDPTPSNNSEFTMTQTLWRDLSIANQIDWYNAGAGVPATLETSFTGTANVGSPAAGALDMLSLVFHEIGHSLGMSSGIPLTVTETMDGDYDFNSTWLFGGTLAADNVDQASDFIGHIDDPRNLMFPNLSIPGSGGSAGVRKLPSHVDLFAMSTGHQYTLLDVPRREFFNPSGDWNTNGNWSGNNTPDNADDVFVRNDSTAILSGFGAAGNLNVLEGGLVSTQTNTLFVQNATTIAGTPGNVSQITVNTAGELDTDALTINDNGRVVIVSTGLLQAENISIASGGELRGYGTVDINSAFGELASHGAIRATNNGELVFTSLNILALALEGGTIDALEGDIRFETAMFTAMGADMTVGAGREVIFNDGGGVGAGGLIEFQGTSANPATVSGGNLSVGFNGVIRANGVGVIENTLQVGAFAILETEPGDPSSELRLSGTTFFQGGRILGDGKARQIGNALVEQDTEIAINTYDMDGIAGNTAITINPNRTFSITSPNIDTVATNDFDGTLNINSGTLDIETAWRLDGILNLTETTSTNPTLRGAGGLTVDSGGQINISGQADVETAVTVLTGTIFVDGAATFTGPTTLGANATVDINDNGDSLQLAGETTLFGPSLVGNGLLRFDGQLNIPIINTFIGTAETDLDGLAGNTQVDVSAGVTFSIASTTIESTANDGFDGVVTNRGTFSVVAGWRLDGDLEMVQVASVPILAGLGTFGIHTTGTYSSSGDSIINPPLEVAGAMVIAGGVTEVNNSATFESTANVVVDAGAQLWLDGLSDFDGGSFTGDGIIRFNAATTIESNTTVDMARVDLDGNGENTHISLSQSALVLNVDGVDSNNNNFAGMVDITGSLSRLEVNLTNPLSAWRTTAGATLNFFTPSVIPVTMLDGSNLASDGTINADGRVRLGANVLLCGPLHTADATTDVHFAGGGQNVIFNTAVVDGMGDVTIDSGTSMYLGSGTNVSLDVENAGRLEVGLLEVGLGIDFTEAGSATIGGNFMQTGTGVLGLEVGGLVPNLQHDVLSVTGSVGLGGTLEIELIDNFFPEIGDEVTLLSAANVSNVFSTVSTFDAANILGFSVSVLYSLTDVTLRFDDVFLLGDYNRNGAVDAADFAVWRNTLGQIGAGLAADGDADGIVDADDYTVWRAHFGQIVGGDAALLSSDSLSGVPEPSTLLLLLTGMLIHYDRRRTTCHKLVRR